MMEVYVKVVMHYGTERIYPACVQAEHFASIAGTKTLSRDNIAHIKALGFKVVVVAPITGL